MTDEERQKMETLAQESERLRTDPAFAEAVITIRKEANADLVSAEHAMVVAVLAGADVGATRADVMRLRAKIEAIDTLCTEIGAQIMRGTPRKLRPVA